MLDRISPIPLWEQLEEVINERLSSGEWRPGMMIPSENAISEEYGLSRMTVRSVIKRFVQEGKLYTVPGKGTFVAEPKILTTPLPYNGIREQLEIKGYKTTTRVLTNNTVVLPNRICEKFNLKPNSVGHLIERVRYIKDKPFSFQRTYLRKNTIFDIPNSRLENEQLCKILEADYGIYPTKVEETLEMIFANQKISEILQVQEFSPLLFLRDELYMDKEMVQYGEIYFKGDEIKLYFEFNKLDVNANSYTNTLRMKGEKNE